WFDSPQLVNPVFSSSVYSFSPNLGVDTLYIQSLIDFCPNIPAVVYVTAIDCEIIVPTAFTPDDDNVNDTWVLNEIDTYYPNNVVSIYNRWGNLIYQSAPGKYESNPWNGKYNDESLPVGSYYFIIEFNDDQTQNKTGIVSIIK
ncbi:MAG: gliding motility-associated C-terminal domain-containing protein, partial [Bacteroidota bacterium]